MAIFAPPLRRTLQELRDDPEGRVVRKDVRSADWDGGTDLSSGPDTTATKGYFFDYSAGAAQFERLFLGAPIGAAVSTAETTTSTSYTDLATAGPAVTVTTGTQALVIITSVIHVNTAGSIGFMGYAVSGATTIAASDTDSLFYESPNASGDRVRASVVILETVTAGSNTFTAKYRVNANTGTFQLRTIAVIPF